MIEEARRLIDYWGMRDWRSDSGAAVRIVQYGPRITTCIAIWDGQFRCVTN